VLQDIRHGVVLTAGRVGQRVGAVGDGLLELLELESVQVTHELELNRTTGASKHFNGLQNII